MHFRSQLDAAARQSRSIISRRWLQRLLTRISQRSSVNVACEMDRSIVTERDADEHGRPARTAACPCRRRQRGRWNDSARKCMSAVRRLDWWAAAQWDDDAWALRWLLAADHSLIRLSANLLLATSSSSSLLNDNDLAVSPVSAAGQARTQNAAKHPGITFTARNKKCTSINYVGGKTFCSEILRSCA